MEAAATAAGMASAAGMGSGEAAGAPVGAAGARDSAAPAEAAVACDGRKGRIGCQQRQHFIIHRMIRRGGPGS